VKYAIDIRQTRAGYVKTGGVELGEARLYLLSEPTESISWVWISASIVLGDPECYAFASNPKGEVLSWRELSLSQKGTLSPAQILKDAGYDVVEPTDFMRRALESEDFELLAVAGDQAEERGLHDCAEACRELRTLKA
jgi:hypothetical protein